MSDLLPMHSKKQYKVRASALVVLVILFCCVITVGVSAVEPCQRAVKRVITEVRWPHYSKATVARWVAWGKEHPNYHPPKRKPIVSTREIQDMVAFACDMPSVESSPVETAMLDEPPVEVLGETFDDARPYVIELSSPNPTVALLDVPVQQPVLPVGETPEPQTWLFLLTGCLFLGVLQKLRTRIAGDSGANYLRPAGL